jgi:hypothetical protein
MGEEVWAHKTRLAPNYQTLLSEGLYSAVENLSRPYFVALWLPLERVQVIIIRKQNIILSQKYQIPIGKKRMPVTSQ